jgi:hypothetical protein
MARLSKKWFVLIILGASLVTTCTLRFFGVGATAKCADGSYSYSAHHGGTCSWHRGVAKWYR